MVFTHTTEPETLSRGSWVKVNISGVVYGLSEYSITLCNDNILFMVFRRSHKLGDTVFLFI